MRPQATTDAADDDLPTGKLTCASLDTLKQWRYFWFVAAIVLCKTCEQRYLDIEEVRPWFALVAHF
jgi:hypothetical protein